MILRLHVFFLFALVLVVIGIKVTLPWKPCFLSASEYIGIDSIKTTSLEEMSEIRLAIALGISLVIAEEWFDFLLMHTGILSGFLYGRYVPGSKFILTPRKSTILRLVCIVIFKLHSLNSLIMTFLFRSISGPDRFLTIAKPSSLYKHKSFLARILINSIYKILQFHKLLPHRNIPLAHQNLGLFPFLPITPFL